MTCTNCGKPSVATCAHKFMFSTCAVPVCGSCRHDESHAGKNQKVLAVQDAGKKKLKNAADAWGMGDLKQQIMMDSYSKASQLQEMQLQQQLQQQAAGYDQQLQKYQSSPDQQWMQQLQGLLGQPSQDQGQGSGGQGDPESSMHWNTPQEWMDRIYAFFKQARPELANSAGYAIELDPTYNAYSCYLPQRFFAAYDTDGMARNEDCMDKLWYAKTVFMNPPYGRSSIIIFGKERKYVIDDFLVKMAEEFLEGRTLENIALIPVATDTDYWQKVVFGTSSAVLFVDKRIKFVPNKLTPKESTPKQANALVYWGYQPELFKTHFESTGYVTILHKYVEDKSQHVKIDEEVKRMLQETT